MGVAHQVMKSPIVGLLLVTVAATLPCRPAIVEGMNMKAVDYSRRQIYHSPQTPGYTCWVTASVMPDGGLLVSFTQATGPFKGRPQAPKEIRHQLSWPPWDPEHDRHNPDYDMTGLDMANVYLRSTDCGKTWQQVGVDPFKSCMNGMSGSQATLADGTVIREVWGHYLPYDPELPKTGYMQRSVDGAKTWAKPELLLDPLRYTSFPRRVHVLSDGRLIVIGGLAHVPADSRTRGQYSGLISPALQISSDGDKTWSDPIDVVPKEYEDKWGGEEFDAAELANGDLLCVFRKRRFDESKGKFVRGEERWHGAMKKRGDSWAPADVGPAPFPHSGLPALLATREGVILHIATSGVNWTADAGQSWHRLNVPPTMYYPTAVQTPDGWIYVFWHRGGDNPYGKVDQYIGMDRFRLEVTGTSK